MNPLPGEWHGAVSTSITKTRLRCGFCARDTNVSSGYVYMYGRTDPKVFIGICNACSRPTFFEDGTQTPGPAVGRDIVHLPPAVAQVWAEARAAARGGAPTAAVMMARTIIAHVAVEKGAGDGLSFQKYVNYLADNHYIAAGSTAWVDYIRKLGNEVIHELTMLTPEQCEGALVFTQALLETTYELPGRVPPPVP